MSLNDPSAGTEPGPFPRGPVARQLPGPVVVGVAGALLEAAVTLAVLVLAAVLSPAAIRFAPR